MPNECAKVMLQAASRAQRTLESARELRNAIDGGDLSEEQLACARQRLEDMSLDVTRTFNRSFESFWEAEKAARHTLLGFKQAHEQFMAAGAAMRKAIDDLPPG